MPRLIRPLLALLSVALAAAACAPVDLLNATISTSGLTIVRDVPYEPGPRHMLDVYRADKAAGALPVVVFFYGGSWQNGDKADYLFAAAALARRGFVVMVPDYRTYPTVQFPGFIEDAAQAVAFARRLAPSYGGDPGRLFLVGHSAGAHIAAMLALNPRYLAAAGMDRRDLAGMAGLAGPYDFLPLQAPDIKAVFSAAADLQDTQPIHFVDGHNPPMLLLAGDADTTVEPRNTTALAAAIAAKGGPVRSRIYPGIAHVGIILAFAPASAARPPRSTMCPDLSRRRRRWCGNTSAPKHRLSDRPLPRPLPQGEGGIRAFLPPSPCGRGRGRGASGTWVSDEAGWYEFLWVLA